MFKKYKIRSFVLMIKDVSDQMIIFADEFI